MAEQPILNTDLEQALYKTAQREKKLRRRATLSIVLPIAAGTIWLLYSGSELDRWRSYAQEIERREAMVKEREAAAAKKVAESDLQRSRSETRAKAVAEQERTAKARADNVQQGLVKVRDEIGGLGMLLNELTSARAKASRLMASEAVESQLADIRSALAKSLGRIEQQIDTALPPSEQKARVFLLISDEDQRAAATLLKTEIEKNGFDVAGIGKSPGRRIDATEVRYFHEPDDKPDAARLQAMVEKQPGQAECQVTYAPDPDRTAGARKFQIWLKPTVH